MNDNDRTSKLRKMATIYLLCLLLPFVSSAFTGKDNGRALLFIVWPLVSLWYFLAYRKVANTYECSIAKHLAFSKGGGGTFHGVLYSLSSFIIFVLVAFPIYEMFTQ
ncbi:hypothetical protein SAMN04488136_13049 [Vibrio xiamenensis]|uniref:Uncharacterized protein n=1 Tax=Vibrio xiamenensis TaxID=861298 RepID=A0A1G8FG79_9VIBR|nr:hypothetical protein [Vibrio xiamenensis]SDH81154.1 hypothetical protein SAMN04488136_13049 [Vibrio xiamenensis]